MRALNRVGRSAAATTLLTGYAVALATGASAATGPVPISSVLRNCDFSKVLTAVQVPATSMGRGTAVFHTSGSTVVADVNMVITNRAGAHYDVGLIQGPRPTSATCGPGDPGVTYTGIDLDGLGQATVTITAPVQQGATGAWVMVSAPSEHNWAPSEYYSTEYMAPV